MTRRGLLALPAFAASGNRVKREVFLRSPGKGTAVMAFAHYTRPRGGQMVSVEQRWSRSDTIDVAFLRRSTDNGRTWSDPSKLVTGEKSASGMRRVHPRTGFADPRTGRYVEFWTEGVLPTDDPLEGLRQWNIFYRVSDGPVRQVIHEGREFSATHALPGVWTGKNCVMLGDLGSVPLGTPDGRILLPVEMSVAAPDGSLFNPGGGYTWTEAAIVAGRWRGDRLEWEMGDRVKCDASTSTRGMVEPTIDYLSDGRLLMILRGSNDKKPELPAYKWVAYSRDGGMRWSEPKPWTYNDGGNFYSPSACSQLLRHSSGRLFWLGNILPVNPRGNRPRYPWRFHIAEVDRRSGLLLKSTVQEIDTLQPGENPVLSLSNFYAREDRETREICVHMTRLFAHNDGWEGDAMLYRVRLPA